MIFLCEAIQEQLRQRHDILLALPERRQGDVDGVYAVVQILTEPAFPDQLLQVHIGCANQPDVHRSGLGAAHTNYTTVLNHP